LSATVVGRWFLLHLILDMYNRKIVGWEAHANSSSDQAEHLVLRTEPTEGIAALAVNPVLHGGNGSTPQSHQYAEAKEHNPTRWAQHTRDWSPIGPVTLNQERDSVIAGSVAQKLTQQLTA
ncbi:MAG: hypothetical protein V4858_05855, partial [Pseudomonadota bacterium]